MIADQASEKFLGKDVPGSLIPYLYLDYVRTGNAGEMSRVFYHNREDIVSMVSLAQRLIQADTAPAEAEAPPRLAPSRLAFLRLAPSK